MTEEFRDLQKRVDIWENPETEKKNNKIMYAGLEIGGILLLISGLGGSWILGWSLFFLTCVVAAAFTEGE